MGESLAPTTENGILGGRIRLSQPAKGYRAGLDAALLAAACDARAGERVLEPGCGAGAAMLAAAVRRPSALFVGIERGLHALALANANIRANALEARVQALAGDVAHPPAPGAPFDAGLCNPPFFDDRAALRAPHPSKSAAFLADDGLGAWTTFLLASVREGGTITLIHRADRLADLLGLLSAKAGSFQVRPVHPFADAPAKRVLVRAVKQGRAPLQLLAPLVLHARGGPKHTPEIEAVLRGEASIDWR
jgi:tRNA1(Val) A37 N6-methylase TrmN6